MRGVEPCLVVLVLVQGVALGLGLGVHSMPHLTSVVYSRDLSPEGVGGVAHLHHLRLNQSPSHEVLLYNGPMGPTHFCCRR